MASLATLTTQPAATPSLSRGRWLMASLASWTLPTGLGFALFTFYDVPTSGSSLILTVACPFFIFFLILFSCLSLANIWLPFEGGPKLLADAFRDAGALPEAISLFTSLTALIAVFSCFSYFLFFRFRTDVPTWERRGTGSRMLYLNGVVSGLEIIFAATLIRLLNSVPHSLMDHSSIGRVFYAPAVLGLGQGSISMIGFVLMVAGPSHVRLPDKYEPIVKAMDSPSRSVANIVESGAQTNRSVAQAAPNQSMAALYQAQQRQRQLLVIQTKRILTVGITLRARVIRMLTITYS